MSTFKEKMNEKIKTYSDKSYLDGYIKNEFLTDNGNADIFLKVYNKYDLFDSRTSGEQLDLLDSIYSFIENKTSMLESDIQIDLHIIGCKLDNKDQESVRHIIKEHYAIELYKIQKEYVKYRERMLDLFAVGFGALFLYSFFYFYTEFGFFLTILSFLFIFSLSEAIDIYIGTLHDIKKNREDITQNLLMHITFENEEKDN